MKLCRSCVAFYTHECDGTGYDAVFHSVGGRIHYDCFEPFSEESYLPLVNYNGLYLDSYDLEELF